MNGLDEFLTEKRATLSAFMETAVADPRPIDFSAHVKVRGRSGVRVIRIRQFELINDTEAFIGGFDVDPNSPEHIPRTPYDLSYSLRICSPEPADRISELYREIEAVCPILHLIKRPQQIEGRLEHVRS